MLLYKKLLLMTFGTTLVVNKFLSIHNLLNPFPSHIVLVCFTIFNHGPGSVVGIVTGYGPDSPGIESRWGASFSAPVQIGPGAHPASCTMGTGSFLGVKSGRSMMLTPHPLLVLW